MKRISWSLSLIAVALLAVTLLSGCGGGGGSQAQSITVKGTEYKFDPADITVQSGQKVTVTFQNNGTVAHNWSVVGMDNEVTTGAVQPGQKKSVEFTPSKAGTYTVDCSIPGHADAGMKGSLTVK